MKKIYDNNILNSLIKKNYMWYDSDCFLSYVFFFDDKNLCIFLALDTTNLSSSDNSSIPKIAIISCKDL